MLTICDNNVNSYAPSNWCSDTLKNIFRCSSRNLVKTRSYLLLERCEFLTDFGFHLKLKCVPILLYVVVFYRQVYSLVVA